MKEKISGRLHIIRLVIEWITVDIGRLDGGVEPSPLFNDWLDYRESIRFGSGSFYEIVRDPIIQLQIRPGSGTRLNLNPDPKLAPTKRVIQILNRNFGCLVELVSYE